MPANFHLVVNITGHGFGHVAQTAPVLNLLAQQVPNLRLTVRSSAPESHLRSRIQMPFDYHMTSQDIGMLMSSPLDVSVAESAAAYLDFHTDWDAKVAKECAELQALQADYVFSNVGYLSLAGAQLAGLPCAAMCSLHWADIYQAYCGNNLIAQQIRQCYAKSDVFFRTTPGMPMTDLPNVFPIGPVASLGVNRRAALNRKLGLSGSEYLVLISMGGITSRLPIEQWARIPNVRWLVQQSWQVQHPDAFVLESLNMPFADILASADLLLCKPGYGSYVEASGCGVPIVYVHRTDWPESACLNDWLFEHNRCRDIGRDVLERGDLAEVLQSLLTEQAKPPVLPIGAQQVVNWMKNNWFCA